MRKCLVITLNGQSMFSEVSHWTFDDVWEYLEIMEDEEGNLRCLFRKENGKCKMKVWQVTLKLNLISELKWVIENRDLEEGAKLVVEGYKTTIECNELDGEFVEHKDHYQKVGVRCHNFQTKIPKDCKITDYGSAICITRGFLYEPNDEEMKVLQELMVNKLIRHIIQERENYLINVERKLKGLAQVEML